MGFILLLALITFSIAGSAAFFSIYGLAAIFAGSFWPVVIMASSLEAGKLVAASYVYRYRNKISFLMKAYLIVAIFILMMITSIGIFGFLSAAYQEDVLPLNEMEAKIVLLDERRTELEEFKGELIARREQLNKQVDDLPKNYATKREIVRKQIAPELDQLNKDIQRYSLQIRETTEQQHEMKAAVIQQRVHTGPIIFIAKAFDKEVDDATFYMVLLIIFAFDPLAVVLTIGTNIAIIERQKEKGTYIEESAYTIDINDEPEPAITDINDLISTSPEQTTQQVSVDQIRATIAELNSRPLNPEEKAQRSMLEEMLRKKEVTERVRTPKEG